MWRRLLGYFGLQGKLVVCMMALLAVSLGSSSWLFVSHSSRQLQTLAGEQAVTLATSLALGSRSAMSQRDPVALNRMARDLVRSPSILFVAFLDPARQPIVLVSRDRDFGSDDLRSGGERVESLMQVTSVDSEIFGSYLEAIAPVHNSPPLTPLAITMPPRRAGPRIAGYVAIGVSTIDEHAAQRRTALAVLAVGIIVAVLSLPVAHLLVHRVFHPIRQLVQATQGLAAGDMDRRVAIDRPDVIGVLARAFNEMVLRVQQQQQALEEANRDLEDKARRRTIELENANRRLRIEIAEKEDFLRAVSHDLNAPLRNIAGMATMLLLKHRDQLDNEVIHRLERIQKNVEVESGLISELLELSRIRTQRQRMEPLDVGALVREILDLFENDLRSHCIIASIDSPLPVLNCERARMRQVFQNLVDNAIKYMGHIHGKPRQIRIGCQRRMTEAEFYVTDTGTGIEPEDVGRIFHVFRRGRNRLAPGVAGKGVGLASVKSIVETYGGTIWVESKPGQGSTFRFTVSGIYVLDLPSQAFTSMPPVPSMPAERAAAGDEGAELPA